MLVTVVIPTFNRASMLGDSIPLLMSQTTADEVAYEVLFVNNGSSDETDQVLTAATQRFPGKLRHINIEASGGPATPRNTGIREARGDVVIILDDDVLPDADLIQQHAEYHLRYPQEEAAAVGVAYVPEQMKDKPVSFFHEFDYSALKGKDVVSYIYFWTCNLSIKRDFMLQHGMFDQRFLYNEDLVCGHKLAAHNLQLRFCPKARGQHIHQLKLKDVPRKGTFVGRWIWATTEIIPDPDILDRYGVLSKRLGPARFMKRFVKRSAFRLLDNPLTMSYLRARGAEAATRSRYSDLYHYIAYRRHIVAGYYEAKRAAARHRQSGQAVDPVEIVKSLPS